MRVKGKKQGRLYPRGTAFHEAGHAVIRGRIGMEPTAVEIQHNGDGFTHGTGKVHTTRGQYEVSLAGIYAEARARKISVFAALLGGGEEDFKGAKEALDWLVAKGFVTDYRAAERRAEQMTRAAIKENWQQISAIAERLRIAGRLEASEVAEIMKEAHP